MTTTEPLPDVPIPAGVTADDWSIFTGLPEDLIRHVTWSRHDTTKVGVAVDGEQFADGRVVRMVSLYDTDRHELTADDSRALAAKLIEAADALDAIAAAFRGEPF